MCPRTSIRFMAPSSRVLDLLPPAPLPKGDAQHTFLQHRRAHTDCGGGKSKVHSFIAFLQHAPKKSSASKMECFPQISKEIAQIVGGRKVGSIHVQDQILTKTRTLLFPKTLRGSSGILLEGGLSLLCVRYVRRHGGKPPNTCHPQVRTKSVDHVQRGTARGAPGGRENQKNVKPHFRTRK